MKNNFLPSLFILGAAKCGTTSLHGYFRSLPDICMSIPKEPFFFEAEYDLGLDYYRERYFPHWKGESIVGESRHRNLILPYVPQRIFATNPNAKLIVIARDPVERCYSHWFHLRSTNDEVLDFDAAIKEDYTRIVRGLNCSTQEEIEKHNVLLKRSHPKGEIGLGLYRTYLDSGYYMEQIRRYVNLFDPSQLKVIMFEEMAQMPELVMREINEFLALEHSAELSHNGLWLNKKRTNSLWLNRYKGAAKFSRLLPPSFKAYVKSWFIKKNEMKAKTRHWLIDHYKPHNAALQNYLNKDISFWQH